MVGLSKCTLEQLIRKSLEKPGKAWKSRKKYPLCIIVNKDTINSAFSKINALIFIQIISSNKNNLICYNWRGIPEIKKKFNRIGLKNSGDQPSIHSPFFLS